VIAEWNMNFSDNIELLGNYRYRPSILSPTQGNFGTIAPTYDDEDTLGAYTGATDSNTVFNVGINQATQEPAISSTVSQTEKMLYSLTDTLSRFRPRSGINKVRYFGRNYLNVANPDMHKQPRFYLASKDDKFKYWNSYRIETGTYGGTERGIALTSTGSGDYYIDDTAPFVVYKDAVAANRLVVKMQTGVGDINRGTYKKSNNSTFNDPFYEDPANTGNLVNQKTPARWKIQYLNTSGTWTTAKTFTLNELRSNGKRVIGSDGYVELAYGITNTPTTFRLLGEYVSQNSLPLTAALGDAYLVPDPTNAAAGKIYHWTNNGTSLGDGAPLGYSSFVPTYGWYLNEEGLTTKTSNVTNLTSPDFYGSATTLYTPTYREFQFVKGIRIVVDTMTQQNSMFDLIEMSPRLVSNLSDKTISYSIDKIASDIGNTGIPVGQLLASTGSLSLFDYDQSFNEYNVLTTNGTTITGSLIADISSKNLQFKFYEQIIDDRSYPTVSDYFVPIKTMYVDGFPEISAEDRTTTLKLRDLLFYFESTIAPSLLLRNVSVSYAIATLLDNIGFSNYKFYRNAGESEDKIPYFYIAPDTNVAQILNDIAQSTQTAMFFDEDNNLVAMSRNYIMPKAGERATDLTLYGTKDFVQDGIVKNAHSHEITAISSNGTYVTYTCKNSLTAGQKVSITGASSTAYNLTNVAVYDASSTQFRVASTATGSTSTARVLITPALSNIASLDAESDQVYNGGKITYSNKYIQKSYSTIQEAGMLNVGQSYKYKPVLLWEVAGTETLRPTNDEVGNQSSYSLSALALNSELSATPPTVSGGVIVDNIMDFGQSIYWLTRYKGYLYANSEIIKYDAVEHSVTGQTTPVWIEDVSDYQKYFATLPFNGKIFPTGRVRIYAEPKYDTATGSVINGPTAKHGRGQFGTTAVAHTVLNDANPWISNTNNHKTFQMQSKWLFQGEHQYKETVYKITGATGSSGSKNITVGTTAGLKEGLTFYEYKTKAIATHTPAVNPTNGNITIDSNAHGLIVGNVVKIKNATPSAYNGIYTVLSKSAHTFTVANTNNASGQVTGATVSPVYNDRAPNAAIPAGTKIKSFTDTVITLTKKLVSPGLSSATIYAVDTLIEPLGQIEYSSSTDSIGFLTEKPTVTGTTKEFFDSSSYTELPETTTVENTNPNGTIKSSALSIQGPSKFSTITSANNALSYVSKDYSSDCPTAYSFGTRMRIVGRPFINKEALNEAKQIPVGSDILNTVKTESGYYDISGTGGGIAINLDTTTNKNIGYYFEITALTNDAIINNLDENNPVTSIPNVFFYKVLKGANTKQAVPVVLWSGNAPILVDDGMFVGMSKAANTKNPTVYDLMVETEDLGVGTNGRYSRKFYLYLNGRLLSTVQDDDAIPVTTTNKNVALFVRGKGLCLFENLFAIGDNSTKSNSPDTKKSVFNEDKLDNENYRKYLVNPAVLQTYLKELGPAHQPKYSLYYEEFGTIMREAAYFNIRYDKAYPALYSKISPTFNDSQGYVVSNFRANPYGAEFLIFNATDFALNLDESTGNYLRIQGVTFTQQSAHDLTVDEYFQKNSDLNNYSNYSNLNNRYIDIQNSRNTYGKKDFTITGNYIQSLDTANNLMTWMVDKVMHPKKSVGVTIFANPMIQLGDIVTIDYNIDNVLQNSTARFVVYHISYSRSQDGPEMKLYLSEVV
jgi:hypothetical protein